MPRVIKEGELTATCKTCGSEIGYKKSEVRQSHQLSDPCITCPVCKNAMYNVQSSHEEDRRF